jgi:hypothetical protein
VPQAQHPKLARQIFDRNAKRLGIVDLQIRPPQRKADRAARRLDVDASEGQKKLRDCQRRRQHTGERTILTLGKARRLRRRADPGDPAVKGDAKRTLGWRRIAEHQSVRCGISAVGSSLRPQEIAQRLTKGELEMRP